MFDVKVAAFCLMPDHYHLLVQTPDANLSRFMRHLDGVYTQRFNLGHMHDGRLFRGRYKSVLIDQDEYLLDVVRYIHRNPIKKGLEERFGRYPWTSHKGYVSWAEKWDWLHREFVLSKFCEDRERAIKYYKKFVSEESCEEIVRILGRNRMPCVLGNEGFVKKVKGGYEEEKQKRKGCGSNSLFPGMNEIKAAVCRVYNINENDLLDTRRGVVNEPRNIAIFMARRLRGDSLETIARAFNMNKSSSVSSVVNRTRKLLSSCGDMRSSYEQINHFLNSDKK